MQAILELAILRLPCHVTPLFTSVIKESVQKLYIFAGPGGDQFVGSAAIDFAILPPHFDVTDGPGLGVVDFIWFRRDFKYLNSTQVLYGTCVGDL